MRILRTVVAMLAVAGGACGAATAQPRGGAERESPPVVATPGPPPGAGAPVMHTLDPSRPIESPHGGTIRTLGVTPAGDAAVTADDLGSTRLWPALDGSREPVIVALPEPRALALGRTNTGFVLAALDQVNGLVLASLGPDGAMRARATLSADPAWLGIAMSSAGLIGWRADQTIELVGDDGTTRSRLGTETGQRLVTVAVTGSHAAAVIEAGDRLRVRVLALAPQLAWGAWIDPPASTVLGGELAIAPSGNRIATARALGGGRSQLVVLDAAGALVASEPQVLATALGFTDDDHLALAGAGGVTWLDLAHAKRPADGKHEPTVVVGNPPRAAIAVAGGRAVTVSGGDLAIATPAGTQYLGYDIQSPPLVAVAPAGQLLVGFPDRFELIDDQLRDVAPLALPIAPDHAVSDLRWLGGDDWLVETSHADTGATQLVLVDVAHKSTTVLRSGLKVAHLLMYEPSSHLATLSLGDAPEVDRYDPKQRTVVRVASAPRKGTYTQLELVPLAPALAGGMQLLQIEMRDRTTIHWLRDARALDRPAASVTVEGSFAAADPTGRVYVWRTTPGGQLQLAVYAAGKATGTIATDGQPVALWPDPSGAQLVAVGQRDVALYHPDGQRLWTQGLAGATEALWLTDGKIAIISGGGIARVDPATGAVQAARCGWRFGLAQHPHPAPPHIDPVCSQLGRAGQ